MPQMSGLYFNIAQYYGIHLNKFNSLLSVFIEDFCCIGYKWQHIFDDLPRLKHRID
jgi:hypothetical protein